MGQFILNMKIHRTETGLCRSPSSWLATDVTFELVSLKDKTALDPHPISISEFGIFWDLGLGWSIFFSCFISDKYVTFIWEGSGNKAFGQ